MGARNTIKHAVVFCLILGLLALPSVVLGQPVPGTAVIGKNNGSSSTTTSASFTPSGSNRALALCITGENSASVDMTVTGCAFSGQTFTKLGSNGTGTGFARNEVWYLANPAASSGTVSCAHAGTSGPQYVMTVIPLTSASQSAPTVVQSTLCTTSCGDTLSVGVTSTANNALLMSCGMGSTFTHTWTGHGTGQTERSAEATAVSGAGAHVHSTSTEVKAVAGAETLSSTLSGAPAQWRYMGIAIPFAAAPPATGRRNSSVMN